MGKMKAGQRVFMVIPEAVAPVFITQQLGTRTFLAPDLLQEKLALQDLARLMVDAPKEVLPKLVKLAMEFCGAVSAGISVHENDKGVFRWHHLHGTLAAFEGATTPRDYSPCGITLDQGSATLVAHPELAYTWVADAGIALEEVLLVPLRIGKAEPLGTLWIVSDQPGYFTSSHARTIEDIAAFAGQALQMIQSEAKLSKALSEQEMLTLEMGHRVKNLFTITDSMIRLTARGADTKEDFANSLSGRLHALASANALARKSLNNLGQRVALSSFGEVVSAILAPYDHGSQIINGEHVTLGEHSINAVALLFHELATNAAKYGAFGSDNGTVSVTWSVVEGTLKIDWVESDGPALVGAPKQSGFGSKLVNSTIASLQGTIAYDWKPAGVVVSISIPLTSLRN